MSESAEKIMDVAEVVAWEKRIAEEGTPLATLMVRAGQAVARCAFDMLQEAALKCALANDLASSCGTDVPKSTPANNQASLHGADSLKCTPVNDQANPHGESAPKHSQKIVILCGTGNNGGDGWVAAKELSAQGYPVTLVSKVAAFELAAEPAHTNALAAMDEGAFDLVVEPDAQTLAGLCDSASLIIDAMLGTGFAYDTVREPLSTWINCANDARANHDAMVLAVDCPSGLNAQTGKPAHECVKADLTVTMLAIKTGLVEPCAEPFVGKIHLALLGVDG